MTRLAANVFLLFALIAPVSITAKAVGFALPLDPMASFERMVEGSWQVTFQSGATQVDTWIRGPGRHSVRVETHGAGAAGEPWRSLEVAYWHPGHEQVRLLGLSPYAQGVMEGEMRFEGDGAEAVFDLHQPGRRRAMTRQWTFSGSDEYRSTLWERPATPALVPIAGWGEPGRSATDDPPVLLAEWTYVRATATAHAPVAGTKIPEVPPELQVFSSLLGRTVPTTGPWTGAGLSNVTTTFEWVPHANYVYARTSAADGAGAPVHLLDTYIYRHPAFDHLRGLALSSDGAVHEGRLTVLEGGAIQAGLKSYGVGKELAPAVRLMLRDGGSIHLHLAGERI